jgi:anti-sigma B factor antagonist
MSFKFDVIKNILIVEITQERATVEISSKLKEELLAQIDDGHENVIVDLSVANFVDSSFLGALVAGLKKATMKSGDLKIVGLQPPVKAMFELTRLYRIFDIFDNQQDAIKSYN